MDDLTHNCPDCHEVTRAPKQHTCGRTVDGYLPASQPHKTPIYRTRTRQDPPPLDLSRVIDGFRSLGRALSKIYAQPDTQDNYVLANDDQEPA